MAGPGCQKIILTWEVPDADAPRTIEAVQIVNELLVTLQIPSLTTLEVEKDEVVLDPKGDDWVPRRRKSKVKFREAKTK